jgi:hypothetical protein
LDGGLEGGLRYDEDDRIFDPAVRSRCGTRCLGARRSEETQVVVCVVSSGVRRVRVVVVGVELFTGNNHVEDLQESYFVCKRGK